jgi:hypothetical protein
MDVNRTRTRQKLCAVNRNTHMERSDGFAPFKLFLQLELTNGQHWAGTVTSLTPLSVMPPWWSVPLVVSRLKEPGSNFGRGTLYLGRNADRGCLTTGRWGEYLDPRGMKWHEAGENCIMRSFIICTLHKRLLGWSKHVANMEEIIFWLVGRSEGIRPLWEPRRRWEDFIKINL